MDKTVETAGLLLTEDDDLVTSIASQVFVAKEMLVNIDNQAPVGDDVEVSADILLRDFSGNIDNAFEGDVQGVVIAETV
jgi:hypothetical protein